MSKKAPKNEIERAYFPFFGSFAEALDNLGDDKTELELYRAITHYGLYGKEPELSGVANAFWALLKPVLEKSRKYFENGAKGGAPKGNKNNRYCNENHNQSTTEIQPNHNQSTTEIQTDKERDKERDKDINIPPISKEIYPPTEQGGGVSVKKRDYEAKKFKRPTLDEVREYIASQSYSVDAEAFIDFYEAKGWRVGNNPMKDWKAAVRTWERRNKEEGKTATKKQDGNTQTDMNRPSNTPRTVDNCGVSVTLGVGEWIDAYGRRTYGSGKATIPEDAPPRPGDKYTWDAATKSWIYL